jgi:hypothetical protein
VHRDQSDRAVDEIVLCPSANRVQTKAPSELRRGKGVIDIGGGGV